MAIVLNRDRALWSQAMPFEPLDINTPAPVLSWANHELGHEELRMAKNMASLPFVYKRL